MGMFKRYRFKVKDEEFELENISGWLPIKYKQVTQHHRLFDLAEDESESTSKSGKKKTRTLCYFAYGHTEYSINQVMSIHHPVPFENEDGKLSYISGILGITNKIGFAVEISDGGEAVRLFVERRLDNG